MLRIAVACLSVAGLALGAELSVAPGGAVLFSRCSAPRSEVARLDEGSRVRLRFAVAGADSRCYLVTASRAGRVLRGYVTKDALEGLADFEEEKRESALRVVGSRLPAISETRSAPEAVVSPDLTAALLRAAEAAKENRPLDVLDILSADDVPGDNRDVVVARVSAFLRMTRAAEASAALDPILAAHPKDMELLYLAAVAAHQANDLQKSTRLLERALAVRYDPAVERLRQLILREAEGDASDARTDRSRFTLLYEGETLPPVAARKLTAEFDRVVNRISFELGCRVTDRLPVIVRSRENYRRATNVARWSGGHYDGWIHIAVPPGGAVDDYVRETFTHEFAHACLARKGQWPIWIHEGLAQRMEGRRLGATDVERLETAAANSRLPKLGATGGAWSRLSGGRARIAYDFALFAVDHFYERHGSVGVRNLLNSPHTLAVVAERLDGEVRERLGVEVVRRSTPRPAPRYQPRA